jgi:hypothetical protein
LFFLSHNYIRLGLTRAKALQTVSGLPRETRRYYAAPKSTAFTLAFILNAVLNKVACHPNKKIL